MIDQAMVFPLFAGAVLLISLLFLTSIYKRCPSNRVLAVYGRLGFTGRKTVQCYHGGGRFVWPLIQDSAYLDLIPRTIHIPLKGALSLQNIRVNVPSTFTVAVGTTEEIMNNAAVRILGLSHSEIEAMATEIIVGQLRLTIASLRIEEINQDRERFLAEIKSNIEPELHKIGLTLINVNITDITDESEYIDSIGKKAASTAVNQAKVDVAEQDKKGNIGKSLADKDRRIGVAAYNAEAVRGEYESEAAIAQANADLAEKQALSRQQSEIARENAEVEIQTARALALTKRMEADEVVPQEIQRQKVLIDAEAEAQRNVVIAKGEAEAILAVRQAEAAGIQKILDAKANGYKLLIQACGNDVRGASAMLLMEKLEEIVRLQADAIKGLKIDKITVWDSGQGGGEGQSGSSTANFLNSMVKTLPALHDIASTAGLDLPQYLGKMTADERVQPTLPQN